MNNPQIKKSVLLAALFLSLLFICACAAPVKNTTICKEDLIKNLVGLGVPQTVRQLEPFKKIKSNTILKDIFPLVGAPDSLLIGALDCNVGSGIFFLVYNLEDGTKVMIGISSIDGAPQYVTHILKDGSSTQMLQK